LNTTIKNIDLENKIFAATANTFTKVALEVFQFQYKHCKVYQQYCNQLHIDVHAVDAITKIPFLPISFFKTHHIATTANTASITFESSGTSGSINSKHIVIDIGLYQQSFNSCFNQFYGATTNWCIIGLLPSYLERNNSSLVYMVNHLITKSNHPSSGFYLHNTATLATTLRQLELQKTNTLLIGVTFALLDFAEQYPQQLQYTTIMETGGMKGRRAEMTRQQVHQYLTDAFNVKNIHSEYGMTELLSQSYSFGNGIFNSPSWKKILIRTEDDPFCISDVQTKKISGAANIIDLANVYSCSFIATDDAATLHPNGSFEIIGRLDNASIRGCSLLTI
jgi:Acyl-protein synthetase, LuxE